MTTTTTDHAAALAALRARITEDWTVDVVDHFYLSESRDGARIERVTAADLVIRPRKAWGSQGMRWPTMTLTWNVQGEDFEVDGEALTFYRTATAITSRSYPGQRQAVRTYRFHPPRT